MTEIYDDITNIIAAIDEVIADMVDSGTTVTMSTSTSTKFRNMRQDLYKIQSVLVS